MKKILKRIVLTLIAGLTLCLTPLVLIALNPSFLYANQTTLGQLTIYHQGELNPDVLPILEKSMQIVQQYLDIKQENPSAIWMTYEANMGSVVSYHHYMVVIQYLMEEKGWSMDTIMVDERPLKANSK